MIGDVAEFAPVRRKDPINTIASSLPLLARLSARLLRTIEDRPVVELDNQLAWMDSALLRGRYLMEFVLNRGGDVVRASDYLPKWKVPDKKLRKRLEAHHRQVTKRVMHLRREPDVPEGLSSGMPLDVLDAFKLFCDDLPHGHPVRDVLGEAIKSTQELLDDPVKAASGSWPR